MQQHDLDAAARPGRDTITGLETPQQRTRRAFGISQQFAIRPLPWRLIGPRRDQREPLGLPLRRIAQQLPDRPVEKVDVGLGLEMGLMERCGTDGHLQTASGRRLGRQAPDEPVDLRQIMPDPDFGFRQSRALEVFRFQAFLHFGNAPHILRQQIAEFGKLLGGIARRPLLTLPARRAEGFGPKGIQGKMT
nr:hypothetical protein [Hydrocarboniphaga sp.]